MRIFVIILLFALLFISQINTIVDTDLWGILKTGEHIIKNFEIPDADIFSYTLKNRTWVDHEWLTQVLFYSVFFAFGWLGLNVLKAIIISLSFSIIFFLGVSKDQKIVYPVFFTLLSVLALGYRSVVRPEIFSYLFLCIFFYVLEKDKRMYMLPFLQIIWVNLHGYFILGPVLIFLNAIGEFFSGERDKAKKYTLIFIWVMLACLVNPYFYKGALYPFRILSGIFTEQKLFVQNISELMMPIKAGFGRFFFFWIFAITTSLTFIVNLRNARIKHILIFAFSFLASYAAIRNIPIFIFLGMPLASMNLNKAALTKRIAEKKYYPVYAFIISLLIYFFISGKYYAAINQSVFKKTESRFSRLLMPSGACDFLEDNGIEGAIFNTLDFGSYIGYRFYPEKRIFIDGRTELYKDDFYISYTNAQNYPVLWRKLHEEYGFKIVLLRHLFSGTERILRYLYKDEGWRLVYYDENSCVYLNDVPGNAEVIERFGIDFGDEIKETDVNINIAVFFEKIGEATLAEKIYIRLLEKDPQSLRAGNNLAAIYINTHRIGDGIKLIEGLLDYYPGSAGLYANMGIAYMRLGQKEQGLLALEKAVNLDPYLRKASYMMGLVYLERGDTDRAIRQFVKYLKLDPYDAGVHKLLGDIYTQKGLSQKAALEYNEADALAGNE